MVSSGTVSSDSSSISSVFTSYSNAINNLDNDSVWQGKSRDNAVSQTRNFVSEFSSPIESQMSDFSKALDKYEDYKDAKEDLKTAEKDRGDILSDDPDADVSSYDRTITNLENKIERLKSEIEKSLSNVESKKLEITPSTIEIESYQLGNFVNYYQGDYSNVSYGYGTSIASAGCGPTSMAMVLTYLTGETVSPPEAAQYSLQHGHRYQGQGTGWEYFGDISNAYGIECESSPPNASKLVSDLKSGKTMIMSMGPGDFTSQGHFIVLRGITDDGRIIVADPASRERSATTWSVDTVVSQSRNMWTFDTEKTVTFEL